ncbi:hypothetical protein NDU88_002796 [Pleurodeles waltl]|uniref:Uncharacterized protein n=1 Tax=Pleurodeles waltl TaxID=8319 RepID=A0AAV7KT63_PLEWA|nr:hypothetical protein NDU88_002796 [Pleurodeles waltl]
MGAICGTKLKSIPCSTLDSDVLSSIQIADANDEESPNENPLEEYVFDTDNGEFDQEELFMEEDFSSTTRDVIRDPLGDKMFSPNDIKPHKHAEWCPQEHDAKFSKKWVCNPLEKRVSNILKAECSRHVIDDKICLTPNLDPELKTILFKLGRAPRKVLERSLKSCLLDMVGTMARIIDMVEDAHINEIPLDINLPRGCSQRGMVLLGNSNSGLNAERRRVVLLKICPKLGDLPE